MVSWSATSTTTTATAEMSGTRFVFVEHNVQCDCAMRTQFESHCKCSCCMLLALLLLVLLVLLLVLLLLLLLCGGDIAATALIAATFTADACHENASAACIKSDANRCNRQSNRSRQQCKSRAKWNSNLSLIYVTACKIFGQWQRLLFATILNAL